MPFRRQQPDLQQPPVVVLACDQALSLEAYSEPQDDLAIEDILDGATAMTSGLSNPARN